jgi:A/G-specific adenine glycosylase
VVAEHGGNFPATVEVLQQLPGVGRSTAGAIVAIAFDRPAPLLDGNVRRVLARLFALGDDPRTPAAERRLWQWAAALTSQEAPHDYAQAIMDLGATVCTPRQPACAACPLAELCQARSLRIEQQLPATRKAKAVPCRRQVALLAGERGRLLVRPRPAEGFLGGLWEFPTVELRDGEAPLTAAGRLAAELGLAGRRRVAGRIRHPYSHFTLELDLILQRCSSANRVADEAWQWRTLAQLAETPLHGAHRKALERYLAKDAGDE